MTERRLSNVVEVRAEGSAANPKLVGYAAVFNKTSKKIRTTGGSGFYERCAPNCFARALTKGNTVALIQHDVQKPLATMRAGTLRCVQDSRGLRVDCDLNPAVSYAMDAWHNAQSGNLRSMSFAFSLRDNGGDVWSDEPWDDDDEDYSKEGRCAFRTVRDIDNLQDVSFLTTGTAAYDDAFCDARTLFPEGTPANVEQRASGLSVVTTDAERVRAAILKSNSLL
jgi:HK97 family phage prohead protease